RAASQGRQRVREQQGRQDQREEGPGDAKGSGHEGSGGNAEESVDTKVRSRRRGTSSFAAVVFCVASARGVRCAWPMSKRLDDELADTIRAENDAPPMAKAIAIAPKPVAKRNL